MLRSQPQKTFWGERGSVSCYSEFSHILRMANCVCAIWKGWSCSISRRLSVHPFHYARYSLASKSHAAKQQTPSEGFFTDGCFVLVEGDYTDEDVLVVIVIGHPPCERRSVAKSVLSFHTFPIPHSSISAQINIWSYRLPGKRCHHLTRRCEALMGLFRV
jgi:hypothetical protein